MFKKINKFYCVQAAKNLKQKDEKLVAKGSHFSNRDEILSTSQILIF